MSLKVIGFISVLLFIFGAVRGWVIWSKLNSITCNSCNGVIIESNSKNGNQFLLFEEKVSGQKLRIITSPQPLFQRNEEVAVSGELVGDILFYPKVKKTGFSEDGSWFREFLFGMRESLVGRAEVLFKQPYSSLVVGIVFGIEEDLGRNLSDTLKKAGLLHVIVASGYNISVVLAIAQASFERFGLKIKIIASAALMMPYAGVAGLDPPVIRAVIMAGGTLLARLVGREKDVYLWLVFSATAMLMVDSTLVFSLSFQLTFAATLGIVLLQSRIEKLLIFFPGFIRNDLATTVAVQIFVLPLIWLWFEEFHYVGLVVNMLTLWMIPMVMSLSVVSILASFVHSDLGLLLGYPVQFLLAFLVWVAEKFT